MLHYEFIMGFVADIIVSSISFTIISSYYLYTIDKNHNTNNINDL
jgi:hypothetical protein